MGGDEAKNEGYFIERPITLVAHALWEATVLCTQRCPFFYRETVYGVINNVLAVVQTWKIHSDVHVEISLLKSYVKLNEAIYLSKYYLIMYGAATSITEAVTETSAARTTSTTTQQKPP